MDTYRAEATGIWAAIAAIRQLVERHAIEETEIKYGCDGKAALEKALQKVGKSVQETGTMTFLKKQERNLNTYQRT